VWLLYGEACVRDDYFSFSAQPTIIAKGEIIWSGGDRSACALGAPGLDLSSIGDPFRLAVAYGDHPITLVFTVRDTSGNVSTNGLPLLPILISPQEFDVPFDGFSGSADFSRICSIGLSWPAISQAPTTSCQAGCISWTPDTSGIHWISTTMGSKDRPMKSWTMPRLSTS
jgi:hypothetical protein